MKTAIEKLNVNKMSGGTFYFLEPQTKNTSFAELRELLAKKLAILPEHWRIFLQKLVSQKLTP